MREAIRDIERLRHILAAIDMLQDGVRRLTIEQIEKEPFIFYGIVKQVEVIGEATYMLTKEFRNTHPDTEWDVIEGMRHVLVHGYYSITPNKVWNVIEKDLPVLRPQIERYIAELEQGKEQGKE